MLVRVAIGFFPSLFLVRSLVLPHSPEDLSANGISSHTNHSVSSDATNIGTVNFVTKRATWNRPYQPAPPPLDPIEFIKGWIRYSLYINYAFEPTFSFESWVLNDIAFLLIQAGYQVEVRPKILSDHKIFASLLVEVSRKYCFQCLDSMRLTTWNIGGPGTTQSCHRASLKHGATLQGLPRDSSQDME